MEQNQYVLAGFVIFTICTIMTYLWCLPQSDELKKYYFINDKRVYAKMDIPEFTDLGVISVHTDEGISRVKDTIDNEVHYTETNMPWRKHRDIGKYVHHSDNPNCEVYKSSPMTFGLRTLKQVAINDELTTDYYPLHIFYKMQI